MIVVHGIDYDGSGIYSGVLDRSELNKALPATATAPGAVRTPRAATQKLAAERLGRPGTPTRPSLAPPRR